MVNTIQSPAHHADLGLFIFLLIYVVVVSSLTYVFSPAMNPNTVSTDMLGGDPGMWNTEPAANSNPLGGNFLSMLWGIMSSMLSLMTFQVPLVPAWLQFILAIPMYAFIIVMVPLLIDFINVLINMFNAVTKWIG